MQDIKWGEVYYADLPINECSSVIGGRYPVIVVQNNVGNKHSPVVTYVPMTSDMQIIDLPTHIQIDCFDRPYVAMCEQVNTVDKHRLNSKIGVIPSEVMHQIIHTIIHVHCNGFD